MRPLSFKCHRLPPDVIRHAVWLYFRLTLSVRDVEEMLAQRDIDVSYEVDDQIWAADRQEPEAQAAGPLAPLAPC